MECFILHFVCAILGFVCKVLKKRGKVIKMCVSSKLIISTFCIKYYIKSRHCRQKKYIHAPVHFEILGFLVFQTSGKKIS